MNSENINANIEKNNNPKKVKLFIFLIILVVFFIAYGIDFTYSKYFRVMSYLKNKYNQKFEITKLIDERQYEEPALTCDGATFIPAKKVKNKYEHYFEVLSKQDNIKFNLYYLEDKKTDKFSDSYIVCRENNKFVKEVADYIISSVDNDLTYDFLFTAENYSLTYKCNININCKEKLNDLLDKQYINKMQAVRKHVYDLIDNFTEDYSNSDGYVIFNVYINYGDERCIKLNEAQTLYVFNKNRTTGIEINNYWGKIDE